MFCLGETVSDEEESVDGRRNVVVIAGTPTCGALHGASSCVGSPSAKSTGEGYHLFDIV